MEPTKTTAPSGDAKQSAKPARAPFEGNVIFVGKKEPMNYVLALVGRFNAGAASVELKARGRTISKAVDITQILKNRFLSDVRIADVKLSTEEVENEDGTKSRVSSMSVTLSR
jgi:DNA-binding protein